MNMLSWLIYFGDVADKLSVFFAAFTTVLLLAVFFWVLSFLLLGKGFPFIALKTILPIAVMFWLLSVALPSSKTIYLIASSEIGEKVATSDEGVELLSDLKIILKGKIKQTRKEIEEAVQ